MDLAADTLRSELIFLPADGRVTRLNDPDDGFCILTPSNPGYWWGNSLRFDRPPRDSDFPHWMRLFETHVHAVQPASTHRTFGWDGDDAGAVDRFVQAGFAYFEAIALAVDRGEPVIAPKHDAAIVVRPLAGDDWEAMRLVQVATRDPQHSEAGYDAFLRARIAGWQALEAHGQGRWFVAEGEGRVVAALGVFAEAERGDDGRRIGRFQHVVTHPDWRRRGLAGMLVAHASRFAFGSLNVDTLYLLADAHDVARRVYEGCGYRVRARQHGLERAR